MASTSELKNGTIFPYLLNQNIFAHEISCKH